MNLLTQKISRKAKLALLAASSAASMVATSANAAFDTAPVVTAIGEAETSGLAVGTTVVGAIAAFVVISVIIGMVRKL